MLTHDKCKAFEDVIKLLQEELIRSKAELNEVQVELKKSQSQVELLEEKIKNIIQKTKIDL